MFSEVEITLFWTWRIKLLDACMVELFGGEYAFAIMMEAKKKKTFLAIGPNIACVGIIIQWTNKPI